MRYHDRQGSQRSYNGVFVVSIGVICALAIAMDLRQQPRVVLMEPYIEFMERISIDANTQPMITSDKDLPRNQVLFYFRFIINDRANPQGKPLTAACSNLLKKIHRVREDLCRNNEP